MYKVKTSWEKCSQGNQTHMKHGNMYVNDY
jgi:hypothetical protein